MKNAYNQVSTSYQPMTLHGFMMAHATEEQCLSAIMAKRWPLGWTCRSCGGVKFYRLKTRRALQCAQRGCRKQISITAGTLFDALKLPLPKIFAAIAVMTDKQGISADALRKAVGCAYDTAFTLLHRLRRAMAERDVIYALSGEVEVDDAYVGGHGDGRHRAGRARDTKRVIGVAVERRGTNRSGFIHIEALPAADAEALHGMILEKVQRGSHLHTDGWPSYRGLGHKGFYHYPVTSPGGAAACTTWPLVHRAIGNLTRWLLGTHRQFCQRHLDSYAAEFCWRINRRNWNQRDRDTNARELTLPDRLLAHACSTRPRRRPDAVKVAA